MRRRARCRIDRAGRAARYVDFQLAQPRISLEHLSYETRPFTRPPEFCGVRDSITQRTAVVGGAALDRTRNAHEFRSHFIGSEADLRVAVREILMKLPTR